MEYTSFQWCKFEGNPFSSAALTRYFILSNTMYRNSSNSTVELKQCISWEKTFFQYIFMFCALNPDVFFYVW